MGFIRRSAASCIDGNRLRMYSSVSMDEVLTISEKVVVRVNDLVTWLSPSLQWSWGREVSCPPSAASSPSRSPRNEDVPVPQVLTDPGIDFSDVEKQQKEYESNCCTGGKNIDEEGPTQTRVVVLSYSRYCRYRALLRRLEGAEPSWLCSSVAAALGGFTALPGTRVLFCRDTFDYPDLETHELLCNHLAPKLKGRPRRKRKKRSTSPGESSNESEASVASTSKTVSASIVPGLRPPSSGVRRSERKASGDEKRFISNVQMFMNSRGTPVGKMPLLGYKQIDLFLFYTKVQEMGGYESVSAGRLWKSIYDEIGGNTGSTSAATITRRHYERLLLPYERHQRGEEIKIRPAHGRRSKASSMSEESDVKQESGVPSPPQTTSQTFATSYTPTSTTVTPPLQTVLSTPFLPGEKPKSEVVGKISSLRSVRVKPERLKSLNTIIANTVTPGVGSTQVPSPPPSSNTPATTPTSTSSTMTITPMIIDGNESHESPLERQLNSPLISHQPISQSPPPPPPSSTPSTIVTTVNNNTTVNANASAVVTLTPPPEKDMKELKLLDSNNKQNSLLAQGKENIPIFGEKTILATAPRSPEVIDLETENDSSRDKIIIPSFKKRKLEILREGGLEVTAVDLEAARPSVIQATITPVMVQNHHHHHHNNHNHNYNHHHHHHNHHQHPAVRTTTTTPEEKSIERNMIGNNLPINNSNTKLISVTVTPDISHMLPSPHDNQNHMINQQHVNRVNSHQQQQQHKQQPTNNNTVSINNNNVVNNSRIINLGSANNTTLLQLYANANAATNNENNLHRHIGQQQPPNGRIAPPKVTQSRSIFSHNEKMVYGNPKDILMPQKYLRLPVTTSPPPPLRNNNVVVVNNNSSNNNDNDNSSSNNSNNNNNNNSNTSSNNNNSNNNNSNSSNNNNSDSSGVLDLTQRSEEKPTAVAFTRPSLEIVRVPIVPRPNLNNVCTDVVKNRDKSLMEVPKKGFSYQNMLDNRTMVSNNLEITLVNPGKLKSQSSTGTQSHPQPQPQPQPQQQQQQQQQQQISSPQIHQIRNNVHVQQQRRQQHVNGKYPVRNEPLSPYTPRKPGHMVIPNIPNIPNIQSSNHLNHIANSPFARNTTEQQQQQQIAIERRNSEAVNEHRRTSESERCAIGQPQPQPQTQPSQEHCERQGGGESQQRHSSVTTNYHPPHLSQLPPPPPPPPNPAFLPQLTNHGEFIPIMDPMYYPGFYNSMFTPPPMPPSAPFLPPEFSAYYKEFLATQPARLAMAGQPAVPTSK